MQLLMSGTQLSQVRIGYFSLFEASRSTTYYRRSVYIELNGDHKKKYHAAWQYMADSTEQLIVCMIKPQQGPNSLMTKAP